MTNPDLQEAFQNRIEQHKKILYKVCNAYCKDRDSREDLAQEITFQLWRSFGKFDGRSQFSTWMYRIALNVAISFYRSEGTRTRHVISDGQRLLESAAVKSCFTWMGTPTRRSPTSWASRRQMWRPRSAG